MRSRPLTLSKCFQNFHSQTLCYFSALVLSCAMLTPRIAVASTDSSSSGKIVYTALREAKLRRDASFLAPAVTTLRYGDPVSVIEESGAWLKVTTAGKLTGYLHASSVSPKKIVLGAGTQSVAGSDASETILAGKGFSKNTEAAYASQSGLNFHAVDLMERTSVTDNELSSFVKEGQLRRQG